MKNSIFDNRFSEQKWYTTDAVHARHSNRTQLQSFHVCFFFSCLCREDQSVVFFSHEEHEDMPLSW